MVVAAVVLAAPAAAALTPPQPSPSPATAAAAPERRPAPVRHVRQPAPEAFLWPVAAPLVDLFRPPATPYGRGNRGIDFDTVAGQPVVAAAPGDVLFAGAVGHTMHVVVAHPGGLRTGYSFLQHVGVGKGQRIERGQVVGRAGDTLHFGVRVGAAYVDPLVFLGRHPPLRPYLVQDGADREDRGGRRPARRWK